VVDTVFRNEFAQRTESHTKLRRVN
jgi:hypothetical protein